MSMKVININDRTRIKKKQDLLEVIDELRKQIESGEIEEFVAASMDSDGDIQIHASVNDAVGGVGLFEIGKKLFIDSVA